MGPIAIGHSLNEGSEIVAHTLKQISRLQNDWLKEIQGAGNEPFKVMLSSAARPEALKWLKKGGFVELIRLQEEAWKEDQEDKDLERKTKLITIQGTEKAMADADKALLFSKESNDISRESVAISKQANITAEKALTASRYSWLATIIAVFLTWLLTKYCS